VRRRAFADARGCACADVRGCVCVLLGWCASLCSREVWSASATIGYFRKRRQIYAPPGGGAAAAGFSAPNGCTPLSSTHWLPEHRGPFNLRHLAYYAGRGGETGRHSPANSLGMLGLRCLAKRTSRKCRQCKHGRQRKKRCTASPLAFLIYTATPGAGRPETHKRSLWTTALGSNRLS
jgi:hypothetical protein